MLGMVGIRLLDGSVKIKEDTPPKGLAIDLKITKISKTERPELANVKFSYTVSYTPNTAVLKLEGDALFTDEPAVLEKIITSWKEKERIDEEIAARILNFINPFVTHNALLMLRAFNLPPHISPPPIIPQKKSK
ncbi:MAG: hypothetical protein QXF35_03015 [Candidatus Bilamarchaeaceae archaeon]